MEKYKKTFDRLYDCVKNNEDYAGAGKMILNAVLKTSK